MGPKVNKEAKKLKTKEDSPSAGTRIRNYLSSASRNIISPSPHGNKSNKDKEKKVAEGSKELDVSSNKTLKTVAGPDDSVDLKALYLIFQTFVDISEDIDDLLEIKRAISMREDTLMQKHQEFLKSIEF